MMQDSIYQTHTLKIRDFIWPISSSELVKFVPMAFLMFTVLLNQNLVRSIKDSVIITLVGPEIISFSKLWLEMPIGILFAIVYAKLCNHFTTEVVFRSVVSVFLIFFIAFGFWIFPNADLIHPNNNQVELYINAYPRLKWFIMIYSKWSFVLFYVIGEMWPVIVFSLLFWQLANKITATSEASRFYSFFALFGQSNLLISGMMVMYFASNNHVFSEVFASSASNAEITLKSLSIIIAISGILCIAIHAFIDHTIVKKMTDNDPIKGSETLKLDLRSSFKMICKSRYLGLICVIVLSYSVAINLIEGLWMSNVKDLYKTTNEFISYQGNVLFYTGCFTLFCSIIGSSIIRYCGWVVGAAATPTVIFIVGTVFFVCVIARNYMDSSETTLIVIAVIGALQNILGKGTKYSFFDTTKEMMYIPLDPEMKTKGKAAVDIVGTKIGKSSGAIIQFLAFTISPASTYNSISPILLAFFAIICIVWLISIFKIKSLYFGMINKS